MYKRSQLSVLKSRMAEPRRTIHVVMGPRQVGKSTMIDQFVEETSVPYSLFSADGVGKTDIAWISEKWHEARTRMMLHNESEHILIIDGVNHSFSDINIQFCRSVRSSISKKRIYVQIIFFFFAHI